MSVRWRLLTALSLITRLTAAQPVRQDDTTGPARGVQAQAHFGVATSPFAVPALPEAKGHVFVFVGGARYAFSGPLHLGVHVPSALGSVAQPAGSYVDAAALGNPQLEAAFRLPLHRSGDSTLSCAAGLALGVPVASHDDDLMPNRVLAVADGVEGRGRPEWFTPGVLPLTPSSSLHWRWRAWSLAAEARLPLLLRVSDASLPSNSDTRRLGLAGILELEARYRVSQAISLAAGAHAFGDIAAPTRYVRDVSPVQDLERVGLHVHWTARTTLIVDVQTAVAGELGGAMVGGGLRAVLDF